MRLVINKPDGVVGIDGVFLSINLSTIPSDIRVVQWHDNYGHIEKYDLSVVDITDISEFSDFIKEHQLKIEVEEKERKEQEEIRNTNKKIIGEIDAKFSSVKENVVTEITSKAWSGLTLAKKIRELDGAVIGLNIDYLFGEKYSEGVAGLLAIRGLLKYAKSLSIPVFAELKPSGIDKEQFSVFFEKLGAKVVRNSISNYMYYEGK